MHAWWQILHDTFLLTVYGLEYSSLPGAEVIVQLLQALESAELVVNWY